MRKIVLLSLMALVIIFFSTYMTFASKVTTHSMSIAHPGRTDRWGCHTCRTNCYRWGLDYGEYHCH